MTPVDIDKLKELLSRTTLCISADLSYEPSEYVAQMVYGPAGGIIRGCAEAEYIGALVNAAPMLIAKAERVERYEQALRDIMELPGEVNENNYDHGDVETLNRSFIATYEIARNALSPKPEDAAS